jgi:acetyltransferase-like isoleucine patch superfamily enzyme
MMVKVPYEMSIDHSYRILIDIEGLGIGNRNIIEPRGMCICQSHLPLMKHLLTLQGLPARLIGTTVIGNNCVIGSACTTDLHEKMEDNTVIYGSNCCRRTQQDPSAVSMKLFERTITTSNLSLTQ